MAEEAQLLLDFQDSLKKDFPNPGRTACPPSEVLRGIASGETRLREVRHWLAHLGSCSACYQDFTSIQRREKKPGKIKVFAAVVATLLVFLALALFLGKGLGRSEIPVLDLRGYESLRGTETPSSSSGPPLILKRTTGEIMVQLPLGSPEGVYELQLLDPTAQEVLLKASGTAHIIDHRTVLRIDIGSHIAAGNYVLRVRQEGIGWSYYSLAVS